MTQEYSKMNEVELCREFRRRYGDDFDFNNKKLLQKTLDADDGLVHELLQQMARAYKGV